MLSEVREPPTSSEEAFDKLRRASNFWRNGDRSISQDIYLPIWLLHHRKTYARLLKGSEEIIDALAREAGLFPYLTDQLTFADSIAKETHRVPSDDDKFFHIEQLKVFQALLRGENVVLLAPTSFGKTYVADEYIKSVVPEICVNVVPTISLLSERRKKLELDFPEYQIVSHQHDIFEKGKAIFVGTQERLMERTDIPHIDFLVVDEFYKMDRRTGGSRANTLNAFVKRSVARTSQYLFIGPNIPGFETNSDHFTVIDTNFSPVYVDIINAKTSDSDFTSLQRLLEELRGTQTFVYFKSPNSLEKTFFAHRSACTETHDDLALAVAEYFKQEIHPEWIASDALTMGIGIHHGKNLRSLNDLLVKLYQGKHIQTIFCTSSLIEGVNTNTEALIVYEAKLSTKNLDAVTFNNIKGRAGRMFEHFIGKVYVFKEPPLTQREDAELPLLDDDQQTPDEVLRLLEPKELTEWETNRKKKIQPSSLLPDNVYTRFGEFMPSEIDALYSHIISTIEQNPDLAVWNSSPDWNQRLWLCERMFELSPRPSNGRSPRTAALFSGKLVGLTNLAAYFKEFVGDKVGEEARLEIQKVFSFLRWVEYDFGRRGALIEALVTFHLSSSKSSATANYSFFLSVCSAWGLQGNLKAISEYGIPETLLYKIQNFVDVYDINAAISALRESSLVRSELSEIELKIVDLALS